KFKKFKRDKNERAYTPINFLKFINSALLLSHKSFNSLNWTNRATKFSSYMHAILWPQNTINEELQYEKDTKCSNHRLPLKTINAGPCAKRAYHAQSQVFLICVVLRNRARKGRAVDCSLLTPSPLAEIQKNLN